MINLTDVLLIDANDIRRLGRPMSKLRDDEDIKTFVLEAQSIDVRPQLTDDLYIKVLERYSLPNVFDRTFDATFRPDYKLLMEGGMFDGGGKCGCGGPVIFEGLKKSIVYYAQARMIQNPNFISRFGIVQRQDEYNSATVELKQRLAYENDTRSAADLFMRNTLKYISADTTTFPNDGQCCGNRPNQRSNIKVTIIGE